MTMLFKKKFHVGWGDMDFNAHMRNTAYLDMSADVRMMYFNENGFSMREFERRCIGPVVMRDELDYFRELRLLEPVTVTLTIAGLNEDASRFIIRNEFFRDDEKQVARVNSFGGWLDLVARKLTSPPEELADLLRSLTKCKGFKVLSPSQS
jgi:acyl-CoA thioester hydrolase